jgi:hypothetical protein
MTATQPMPFVAAPQLSQYSMPVRGDRSVFSSRLQFQQRLVIIRMPSSLQIE